MNYKQESTNYKIPSKYKNDKMMEYMIKEIAKYKPISKEDEKILFSEYFDSSTTEKRKVRIKEIIISCNMRFVLSYALQYEMFPIDLKDLVSEGKLGLIEAIDLFDLNKNKKFISFAVWHIRSKVSKFLEENDLIRLPSHQKVKLNREKKNKDFSELDDETKILYELTQPKLSFDSPLHQGSDLKLCETINDPNYNDLSINYLKNGVHKDLIKAINQELEHDERLATLYLFGFKTDQVEGLRETGEMMSKSHERIRQLRDQALKKLRNSELLKDKKFYFQTIDE